MRILVNTRLLIKDKLEGIGWFSYETLKRITQNHPEHEFIFVFDRKYDNEFIFSKNITPIIAGPQARHPFLFYTWFEFTIPYLLKKHKADLFFSPDGYISLSTKVPTLSVIHDINFIHFPKDLPWLISYYYHYFFPKFAQKSKRIITVSEYSANDIHLSFSIPKDKIDIVYNGSHEVYKPLSENEKITIKKEISNSNDYFVFIGSLHPRKNISRLLLAFDRFKSLTNSNIRLVIIGNKMFKTDEMQKVHRGMRHNHEVIFTGRQTPEMIHKILGASLALTFVPYFEGFGIPLLEAMNCDVPIISSNVTSMPEVCGNAALYVDPFSIDSISTAMQKIAFDEKLRFQLITEGRIQRNKFNWDKTAERIWESIESCM